MDLFMVLCLILIPASFIACNSDSDDEQKLDNGSSNLEDVAVTSTPASVGYTCTEINGYVNLERITAEYSSPNIGIQIDTLAELSDNYIDYYSGRIGRSGRSVPNSNGLFGRQFKIKISELEPNTTYYYRTYVDINSLTYYGKTYSFTTKRLTKKDIEVNVNDIGCTVATLSCVTDIANDEGGDIYTFAPIVISEDKMQLTKDGKYSKHIITAKLSRLSPGKTYYYATLIDGEFLNMGSFETKPLQETGYIDLGLSVLWAACNEGAQTPEESGNYYTWEECLNMSTPTYENYSELKRKCDYFQITYKNTEGYIFENLDNMGNAIFFPKADGTSSYSRYYWTRTKYDYWWYDSKKQKHTDDSESYIWSGGSILATGYHSPTYSSCIREYRDRLSLSIRTVKAK